MREGTIAFRLVSIQSDRSELRSCVKEELDFLGSPSLIVCMVSVVVKQH